jgi:hypothetical protein
MNLRNFQYNSSIILCAKLIQKLKLCSQNKGIQLKRNNKLLIE